MVFLKKYFMDPAKRQIFRDASGQIFSLILRPCHMQKWKQYNAQTNVEMFPEDYLNHKSRWKGSCTRCSLSRHRAPQTQKANVTATRTFTFCATLDTFASLVKGHWWEGLCSSVNSLNRDKVVWGDLAR